VLGTLPFGSLVDDDTSFAILDRYADAGGTFLDTADTANLASAHVAFSSPETSAATTFAPSRWNRSATARPMPEPAPVTIATLPSSRAIGVPLTNRCGRTGG